MLVGLVDPSHEERSRDEPGRLPRWLPLPEVLAAAATAGPAWSPWPYELLNGAIEQWQERDYLSVSMLTGGCARGKVLERKENFILTVDDMYPALRGTLIHQTLEHAARPNSLAEARFFTTVRLPNLREPLELSCSPDIITWNPDALGDYKVTENPPDFYPWKSHTRQVQYNQWLVRHAESWTLDGEAFDIPFNPREWKPEHLYLVYLAPKGPKVIEVQKTRETTTPKGAVVKRKMPYVWSDEQVEESLFPRLRAMAEALASYPEWPFGEDEANEDPKDGPTGFAGPPGWACPGYPWCSLPRCLAKRYPTGMTWESP